MTRAEIIKMFEMRLDGETLQTIANKYGLTRERVRQLLTPSKRTPKEYVCIYPGLKKVDGGKRIFVSTFYAGQRATHTYQYVLSQHYRQA